jgi:tripartite-type tricarboxylate transporter receptor subunit TctC
MLNTTSKTISNSARLWRTLCATFCSGWVMLGWSPAGAQDYPNKTITIVIPFASGSGTDQIARAYAQAITQLYKVPVVVDAKPGASGFIAAQYVAKAPNDGYTVLYTTNTTHAANEHFFKKIPYDPVKDFSPVALLSKGHMALVVPPNSPFKTVADIVAEAKKRPGHINFGSGSSSSRMASEMFKQLAGVQMVNVPYKSNPLVITDLMGGQLDFMFTDAATGVPQITGGKLRALAVSGTHRLAALAQVPTMEEAGIKGYDMSYWTAAWVPAKTPKAIIDKLNQLMIAASKLDPAQKFYTSTGSERYTTTPDGLAKFQALETNKWGSIIKEAKIDKE